MDSGVVKAGNLGSVLYVLFSSVRIAELGLSGRMRGGTITVGFGSGRCYVFSSFRH